MFDFLNPYILWIKLVAVAVVVIALLGSFIWFCYVLGQNEKLKEINARQAAQLETAAKLQDYANKVTEAIGQIKIRSSVNVQRIEAEPKPVFAGAAPLPFIAGGVLQAVYSSAHRPGAASGHAGGGSLPADGSPGGILPDRSGPQGRTDQP